MDGRARQRRTTTIAEMLSLSDKYRLHALVREIGNRSTWRKVFPALTDHATRHAERLIEVLDRALPDRAKRSLSAREAFVLLASAHLHDVGLHAAPRVGARRAASSIVDLALAACSFAVLPDIPQLLALSASLSGIVRPAGEIHDARAAHASAAKEMIAAAKQQLGLSGDEATVVGRICAAHAAVGHLSALDDGPLIDGETVRERLLGSILRFGDDLELGAPRSEQLAALLLVAKQLYRQYPSPSSRQPSGHELESIASEARRHVRGLSHVNLVFAPREKTVFLKCPRMGVVERELLQHVSENGTSDLEQMRPQLEQIRFPYTAVKVMAHGGRAA